MMQLQLKILQERQKNVALKKMVAQNIISQNNNASKPQSYQPASQNEHSNLQVNHRPEFVRRDMHGNKRLQGIAKELTHHSVTSPSSSHLGPSDVNNDAMNPTDEYIHNEVSNIQNGNQDELKKDEKPARVKFMAAQPNNQKLHSLQEQITSIVQETTKLFSSDVDDQLPVSKRKLKQQRAAHIKHKQDVQSLLQTKNTTNFEILPKWKHVQLRNNPNPPSYTLIKSARLWRIVAWALVVMVTTPIVDVYKK